MCFRARSIALLLTFTVATASCLPDAIPFAKRIWVKDDEGSNLPIGIFESAWDSSYMFTALSQILIEEVLGYHTVTNEELGSSGAAAHFALAGCLDWNSQTERQCDLNETRMHLCFDSWMSNWPIEAEAIQKYPHLVAEDLGSMGYDGVEGIYATREVLDKAYESEGLALNFYLSYNQTHHDAKKHLDGIASVNTSRFQRCNESNFFNKDHMDNYLRWTGDAEGLVQLDDGRHVAKCSQDVFWLSPACRGDAASCILAITASPGWAMQDIMQWAAAYAMPLALGVANTFADEVSMVQSGKFIFYWFQPDATFALLSPGRLIFPPYSAQQRALGNRKTASKPTYVNKACSRNLQFKAPKVKDFASRVNFELEETQELLSLTQGGLSFYQAACQWIQANRERWEDWTSVTTSCSPGYGLADESGAFVSSRENAQICEECPPGSFSERFTDRLGPAYRCTLCAAGSSQNKAGESQCYACVAGTYNNNPGRTSCKVCPVGFYQNEEGKTECIPCHENRTTLLLAAKLAEDCVCKATWIDNNGTCVDCMEGLRCPKGSTVQLLMDGESDLRQGDDLPSVEAGYRSTPESPLEIYRCVSHCPGGRPGRCDAGLIGVTCGSCPTYEFIQDEECRPCRPVHSALWISACPVIFIFVVCSYYLSNGEHTVRATVSSSTFTLIGLAVVFCEIVAVLQDVAVQWPASLGKALSYFEIFGLSFDSLGLGCLAGSTLRSYILQSFFFPTVVLGSLCMQLLSQLMPCPKRLKRYRWTRPGTCNMLGHLLQEGYITMSNIAFIPFSCFTHPSGAESLLTATNVLCGSTTHSRMQVWGTILGLLCLAFLAMCCYAAYKAPSWCGYPVRMSCIRFLIDRFRPDVWWFGIILLVRGPALSLPAIIAANVPGLQMTGLLGIMLISVLIQVRFLPWSAPLANITDAASSSLLLILLSIGIARLPPPPGEWAGWVLDISGIMVALMILSVWVLALLAVVIVLFRKTVQKRDVSRIINLGTIPQTSDIALVLEEIAASIHDWTDAEQKRAQDALGELSIYDYRQVCTALMLLNLEVGLGKNRLSSRKSNQRIINRGAKVKGVARKSLARMSLVIAQERQAMAAALANRSDSNLGTEPASVTTEDPASSAAADHSHSPSADGDKEHSTTELSPDASNVSEQDSLTGGEPRKIVVSEEL